MSNVPQSNYPDIPADEMKELMDEMVASEAKSEDGDWGEPISVYSDAQAVEDGDLTQFTTFPFKGLSVNRMTDHLFHDLKPFVESIASGLDDDFGRGLASILRTKCELAQGDPGNTGEIGDIYKLPPNLCLVRNEVGGWTAMFPEDY
jgi:hypothetical protein